MNNMEYMIKYPSVLLFENGKTLSYGANQSWYFGFIKKMSGCGPTVASNLLWYLSHTNDHYYNILQGDLKSKKDMVKNMKAMYTYVTPGMRGVDSIEAFVRGLKRFAKNNKTEFDIETLEVSDDKHTRINKEQLLQFLVEAFSQNAPVGFLNLSNGGLVNLDNWHWVTLIGVEDNLQAMIYDQGKREMIDLNLWLQTTTNGGAFVYIKPKNS